MLHPVQQQTKQEQRLMNTPEFCQSHKGTNMELFIKVA